jgi:hypothetical protein
MRRRRPRFFDAGSRNLGLEFFVDLESRCDIPHVGRRAAHEKIFARWCEYVHDFDVVAAPSFVLNAAGDHRHVAAIHHPPLIADAEFHLAVQKPDDLLVRMRMRRGMRPGRRCQRQARTCRIVLLDTPASATPPECPSWSAGEPQLAEIGDSVSG